MKLTIFALILIAFVVGCTTSSNEQIITGGKPTAPLNVNLDLSPLPPLNQDTTLTFRVEALLDEAELDISIQLPEGIEIVDGNLKQTYYEISADDEIKHKITIKVTKTGDYRILGGVRSEWSPSYTYGKGDEICISVQEAVTGIIDCHPTLPPTSPESQAVRLTDPFKGTFQGSDEPKLNSSIKVIFSFTPDQDFNDVNVKLYLPTGISLLKGGTEWYGNVAKGENIELPIQIKIISEKYMAPLHAQVSGYSEDAVAITTRSYYYSITDLKKYRRVEKP